MIRVLELFGGIGACTAAIKRLGIDYEVVDYVEIDKFAVKSYNAINGTNFEPQDIVDWDKNIKDVDLIMHGSPCQDFSIAGKQAGGDVGSGTRSSLMYETIRIVNKLKPKYVVWENVKNLLSVKHRHNFEAYLQTMSEMGYKNYYQVLNAKYYGIPQNRERVFTISILNGERNFEFPKPFPLELELKDLLEDNVDKKYYVDNIKFEDAKKLNKKTSNTVRSGGRGSLDRHQWDLVYDDYNSNIKSDQTTIGTISTKIGNSVMRTGYKRIEYDNSKTIQQVGQMYGTVKEPNPQAGRIYSTNGISPTLDSCSGGNRMPKILNKYEWRIRKLTPKECWRLMGFSDEDFEKAENVNSNIQLYKQAGNSIVVDVLYHIFKNLLSEVYKFELLKG